MSGTPVLSLPVPTSGGMGVKIPQSQADPSSPHSRHLPLALLPGLSLATWAAKTSFQSEIQTDNLRTSPHKPMGNSGQTIYDNVNMLTMSTF